MKIEELNIIYDIEDIEDKLFNKYIDNNISPRWNLVFNYMKHFQNESRCTKSSTSFK
jgi:hypothetical protein